MNYTKEDVMELLKMAEEILPDEDWNNMCGDVKGLIASYGSRPEAIVFQEIIDDAQKRRTHRYEIKEGSYERRSVRCGNIFSFKSRNRLGDEETCL